MTEYSIDCTGNVCAGDEIEFQEAVFGGSYRNPCYLGERTIRARVSRESYGRGKQQHTFTLEVTGCEGYSAADVLQQGVIRRKGRNVYRNGTRRKPWADESARQRTLREKYARGGVARAARSIRIYGHDCV